MTNKSISELLARYALKQCTREEEERVDTWFAEHGSDRTEFEQMEAGRQQEWIDLLYADIDAVNAREIEEIETIKVRLWPKIAIAAAVFIAIGIFLYSINYKSDKDLIIEYANTIKPVERAATLTLANGKVVPLSDAKGGIVIEVAALSYTDGSKVLPSEGETATAIKDKSVGVVPVGDLVINTPYGRQYQMVLPDGTKVWLNAGSSIRFSSSFLTQKTRAVKLTGEAYFEVVKDKDHPFVVQSNAQEVEVLGTHFNINSYRAATKTTLLEGVVKVSTLEKGGDEGIASDQTVILKPGEEAVQRAGNIEVRAADLDQATAWKDGWFYFKSASLSEVLNEAALWYDLKVSYEANIPADRFTGKVPRTASLGTFIKMLQLSDIKFRLIEHQIVIEK